MGKSFTCRGTLLMLAACMLSAVVICALHAGNAVRRCGTIEVIMMKEINRGGGNLVSEIEVVFVQNGVLHVSGYLARPGQSVGEVRVRLGLRADDEVTLLNTQMVRRPDIAGMMNCEVFCGAHAAAKISALNDGEYQIVWVDTGGEEPLLLCTDKQIVVRNGRIIRGGAV